MLDSTNPSSDPASMPQPGGSHWTPVRLELRSWLQRNSSSLAELYEGAVKMVFEVALPGRIRFVSHAVREIRNRLPDVISGAKGGGRLDYKSRMDVIEEGWMQNGYTLDGSFKDVTLSEQLQPAADPDIQIPRQLLCLIVDLIRDHSEAREKPIETATRLFEGLAPENQQRRDTLRPVVLQWLKVTDWFMGKTHDSGKVDADYDESEFRQQFEIFELTLSALVRVFFSTVEGLDEILEDANS